MSPLLLSLLFFSVVVEMEKRNPITDSTVLSDPGGQKWVCELFYDTLRGCNTAVVTSVARPQTNL
ncbi:uncharacterized protein OE_7171F (plasmid) [Halobacterium salinarum R1]|uniref:Uncharacterized protein n=2 Tax=Halobacterium salinarum NRC-34001 TaxID=2886895 RepID=A0A510NAS1_HALSA|nr:uncharacterized protein OE_7171F [Halobacterium salinarum R1]DAC79577.1 TPA_inf: uncharacterized protein VNG_7089c [Halobacterium salinarum NRC-1]DAC79774.1 TPA_inf: uncharacterized protein VNG_6126b [Halobacterium salinarum NRC-1]